MHILDKTQRTNLNKALQAWQASKKDVSEERLQQINFILIATRVLYENTDPNINEENIGTARQNIANALVKLYDDLAQYELQPGSSETKEILSYLDFQLGAQNGDQQKKVSGSFMSVALNMHHSSDIQLDPDDGRKIAPIYNLFNPEYKPN